MTWETLRCGCGALVALGIKEACRVHMRTVSFEPVGALGLGAVNVGWNEVASAGL